MKTTVEKDTVSALNDLIKINNDRIEGYTKASDQAKNLPELQKLFEEKANESRTFVSELNNFASQFGTDHKEGTTVPGKIYRGWMDIKNTFNPSDSTSILDSCEFGEDAALKAYEMALKSDTEMDAELRAKILDQQSKIKASHDQIKMKRDTDSKSWK